MPLSEAQQAVLDLLITEPGPVVRAGSVTPNQPVASVRLGGGSGADPTTVRFVRCREFPECQLHAVSYRTRDGHAREDVYRTVKQVDGRLSVHPIGGGGGGHPHRDRPWINFTAQWSEDSFAGGGYVIGNGAERARRVCITFADETCVEDELNEQVALFFVPHAVTFPARVEIFDDVGTTLAVYEEFAAFA